MSRRIVKILDWAVNALLFVLALWLLSQLVR